MARPLRILLEGGWYHVTSRGNRRQPLFLKEQDRQDFLAMIAQLPDRFGLEIHAFVLMDNHYHLVVRTPQANLSQAIHWLNVSYGCRFNWRHRMCGHVFQGRFKAILIEEMNGVMEMVRYVHLNPVRVGRLGLGKADRQRSRAVGIPDPGADLVRRRLEELKNYRWSSWRVYSGLEPAPAWLETATIEAGCGGRTRAERRQALREYTEEPVRQGHLENPWSGLVGGLVLGDMDFLKTLLEGRSADKQEQTGARLVNRGNRLPWSDLVQAAEKLRGRSWQEMLERKGEWGRDGTMYVGVRFGGYRLVEVVRAMGGIEYQAAAQALRRFEARMKRNKEECAFVEQMKRRLNIGNRA